MKKLILIALIFAGCEDKRKPQENVKSSNETYQVQLLFEVDGCKVYRFVDKSEYRYFVNTKGSTNWSTTETQRNGKTQTTTTTNNTIETNEN